MVAGLHGVILPLLHHDHLPVAPPGAVHLRCGLGLLLLGHGGIGRVPAGHVDGGPKLELLNFNIDTFVSESRYCDFHIEESMKLPSLSCATANLNSYVKKYQCLY